MPEYKAIIEEYERGWGSRIDEIRNFTSEEDRDNFIKEFNSRNTEKIVPDWYMVASKI